MNTIALATIVAGALAAPLSAATIFEENFDDEATTFGTTLNFSSFDQFGVSGGTVDLIGPGNPYGISCVTIGCVDLDGSTRDAGMISAPLSFLAGVTYTLEFRASGNQRNTSSDTLNWGVTGGLTAVQTTVFAGSDPFDIYAISFTPGSNTLASVTFENLGGDNFGVILDGVRIRDDVAPVPVPAAGLLLLSAIGALALRRP